MKNNRQGGRENGHLEAYEAYISEAYEAYISEAYEAYISDIINFWNTYS